MNAFSGKPLMRKRLRTGLALGALGITALASVVSGREEPVAEPAAPMATEARGAPSTRVEVASLDIDLDRLHRIENAQPIAELFTAAEAPAPGPDVSRKKNLPPPPPPEPPLPFRYLGKVIDEGKLSVFLTNGTVHYSVQPGQTVAGAYRVDAVTDSAVTFTYLPTGSHKTLSLPAVSVSSPSPSPIPSAPPFIGLPPGAARPFAGAIPGVSPPPATPAPGPLAPSQPDGNPAVVNAPGARSHGA